MFAINTLSYCIAFYYFTFSLSNISKNLFSG